MARNGFTILCAGHVVAENERVIDLDEHGSLTALFAIFRIFAVPTCQENEFLHYNMVSLEAIRNSNSRVAAELPVGLVAAFVGATSGIGEAGLEQFVKYARTPRVYFIGESNKAAARNNKTKWEGNKTLKRFQIHGMIVRTQQVIKRRGPRLDKSPPLDVA
ncbi:hypothetical protein K449DRAFT_440375 [Hypoxylon sp. EC38]|nr:hypothetical protein K449DRAFT_440375 [Hypoxylon sp. EC38]